MLTDAGSIPAASTNTIRRPRGAEFLCAGDSCLNAEHLQPIAPAPNSAEGDVGFGEFSLLHQRSRTVRTVSGPWHSQFKKQLGQISVHRRESEDHGAGSRQGAIDDSPRSRLRSKARRGRCRMCHFDHGALPASACLRLGRTNRHRSCTVSRSSTLSLISMGANARAHQTPCVDNHNGELG